MISRFRLSSSIELPISPPVIAPTPARCRARAGMAGGAADQGPDAGPSGPAHQCSRSRVRGTAGKQDDTDQQATKGTEAIHRAPFCLVLGGKLLCLPAAVGRRQFLGRVPDMKRPLRQRATYSIGHNGWAK